VFTVYRDDPALSAAVTETEAGPPLLDFRDAGGTGHTIWRVAETGVFVGRLEAIPAAYIADGHHRAAAAAAVYAEACVSDPESAGARQWFLSIIFPASQVRILPYHRVVRDLNGLTVSRFRDAVAECFALKGESDPDRSEPGSIRMYVDGRWYRLTWKPVPGDDPVSRLDVAVLQERLLAPVLGVEDPRRDGRIDFVGGDRGRTELTERVDSGKAAVGFSLHPLSVSEMMRIADTGRLMPPKSTWFDPKPRSGLLVHLLEAD
jgi:uncharacterized protein (DUF1015 family)